MTNTHLAPPVTEARLGNPVAPALAGLAAIGLAIYQVATPGTPAASYDSVTDWLRETLFLAYLIGSIVGLEAGRRSEMFAAVPVRLVQAGYALIGFGAGCGMVLRDDPDWFFVLAGPGLLLSTVGFVWLAVSGARRRTLPVWAALLAGVGGAVAIIMAELGTSVLIGAFWLYLAQRSREV